MKYGNGLCLIQSNDRTMSPTILEQQVRKNRGMNFSDTTASARSQSLAVLEKNFQEIKYVLNQHALYAAISLTAKVHGSRNQGVELEEAPLSIFSRGLTSKICGPYSHIMTLLA